MPTRRIRVVPASTLADGGRLTGTSPALGSEVSVRLERADPATRTVAFSL
jgi:hypothetical protein